LHIYKQVKFRLDWHLSNKTTLCIGLNDSNGKVIPCYKSACVWIDGQIQIVLHPKQHETLYNMLMRSWVILGSNSHIVCSKQNISGEGCNYKFSSLFFNIWCVTKFVHHSMHLHFNYSLCSLWGKVINWIWILPTH
jgi:hypothetical protein